MILVKADKELFKKYVELVNKGELSYFDFALESIVDDELNGFIKVGEMFEDYNASNFWGVKRVRIFDANYTVCGYWGGGGIIMFEENFDDINYFVSRVFDEIYDYANSYIYIEITKDMLKGVWDG